MLFSNALLGLREGFEAALVVSILVAFLVKTGKRDALKWVWTGVGAAVLLSVTIGAVLTYGTESLTFETQELVGGSLSILAVALVTGMIFWMRATARTIAAELRGKLSDAVGLGPLAVIVVAFLSVGREGLETAVFFYAAVQTAGGGTTQPLIGFVTGILVAVILGFLLYKGAVRLNLTKFFKITGVLLILVAAGVLGYGLHDLQEARFLPGLTTLAFDLSGPVPEDSWYGTLLKGIFNYSQQTTVLQAIAWVAYVAVVLTLFLWPRKGAPVEKNTVKPIPVRSS
ncbi:iron uptake transporter permease EfeU [Actinocrispum sp. NPDC049592]|uniref:iron uptake transporter permease EfeU n=1 Tax=Actinocrispum sp. NPDC049592 TaxID=3154835 RepID=UPI00342F6C3D